MRISLMRLAHRTPGLRAISKSLPPVWFFRWAELSTGVSLKFYSHRRKSFQLIRRFLADHCDAKEIERVAKRYTLYRHWLNQLEYGWENWAGRYAKEGRIEGEQHLHRALAQGRGVLLLSGHYLGFSRFVAPFLAERNYRISRAGSGMDPQRRANRWGSIYVTKWQYIHYHGDLWTRTKALHRVRAALRRNELVHMSILCLPQGDPQLEFDLFSARLFLDPTMFEILSDYDCPRLPCLALCDSSGGISLEIAAPLHADVNQAIQEFKNYYRHWLHTTPELMREWDKIGEMCDAGR